MAFEATHVRFANDLAKTMNITDHPSFFAGAVYPDSRYVTKIGRDATHDQNSLKHIQETKASAFEKGWNTHLIYDELAKPEYMRCSPWPDAVSMKGSKEWMYTTAEKIVEDIQSYDALGDDVRVLRELTCPPPKNGEDPELLEHYYQLLRDLYRQRPTLADYRNIFSAFNIPLDVANGCLGYAETALQDEQMIDAIKSIYSAILSTSR